MQASERCHLMPGYRRRVAVMLLCASTVGVAVGVDEDWVKQAVGLGRRVNYGHPPMVAVARRLQGLEIKPLDAGDDSMAIASFDTRWRKDPGPAPVVERFDRTLWIHGMVPALTEPERAQVRAKLLELAAMNGMSTETLVLLRRGDGESVRIRWRGVLACVSALSLVGSCVWMFWPRRGF